MVIDPKTMRILAEHKKSKHPLCDGWRGLDECKSCMAICEAIGCFREALARKYDGGVYQHIADDIRAFKEG